MDDLDMKMRKAPNGFAKLTGDAVYEQHVKDKLKSTYNEVPYANDCGYVYSFTKGTASIITLTGLISEIKSIFKKSELIILKSTTIKLNKIKKTYDVYLTYIPKSIQSVDDKDVKAFNFKLV